MTLSYCPHCGGSLRNRTDPLRHSTFDDIHERLQIGAREGSPIGPTLIPLTPFESRLLRALRERPNAYVSYTTLDTLPSEDSDNPRRTITVYICHLRRKLRGAPFQIRTRHGFGYGIFETKTPSLLRAF